VSRGALSREVSNAGQSTLGFICDKGARY
jgi:hypothetical protein